MAYAFPESKPPGNIQNTFEKYELALIPSVQDHPIRAPPAFRWFCKQADEMRRRAYMLDRNKYFPNYQKIYPELIERPDILKFLNQSDQKMKYMEVDLKQNEFVQDLDKKIAVLLPSREDSLERLCDEERRQFPDEQDIEAQLLERDETNRLRGYISELEKDEQKLLYLRYWKELTQAEVAKYFSVSQPTISYREKKILQKIKTRMERQ